jgi:RsiW-degrading membrane proteinase PrsW (M82 family)
VDIQYLISRRRALSFSLTLSLSLLLSLVSCCLLHSAAAAAAAVVLGCARSRPASVHHLLSPFLTLALVLAPPLVG